MGAGLFLRELRIADVTEQHEVDLIPVREALSRRSSSGRVLAEDPQGLRVVPASLEELADSASQRRYLARALPESLRNGDVD